MNAVSLFSGIGGFDRAFNLAGIPVVATVEIDKQARGVLEYHWPDTTHFEDITKVSGDDLRSTGFIPDDGIIMGGFPCQDVSIAGRRAGFDGERSVLFYEFVRLIEETQSEWALFENVPGLLSSRGGRDMGAVIGTLVELGYGCSWRVLDSRFYGAAQRRRRLFILARRAGDAASCAQILFESEGVRGDPETQRNEGQEVAGGTVAGTLTSRTSRAVGADDTASGHLIVNEVWVDRRRDAPARYEGTPPTLDAHMGTGGNNVPFVKVIRSGARDAEGNLPPEVWAERDVAPTLNQFDQSGESRTPVLLTMRGRLDNGKGGTGALLSEDVSLTLATGNNQPLIYDGVRRLTPIECERLQMFPDDWTKYRLQDGKVIEQADSARYKQMGNALTVTVGEWIAKRLKDFTTNA